MVVSRNETCPQEPRNSRPPARPGRLEIGVSAPDEVLAGPGTGTAVKRTGVILAALSGAALLGGCVAPGGPDGPEWTLSMGGFPQSGGPPSFFGEIPILDPSGREHTVLLGRGFAGPPGNPDEDEYHYYEGLRICYRRYHGLFRKEGSRRARVFWEAGIGAGAVYRGRYDPFAPPPDVYYFDESGSVSLILGGGVRWWFPDAQNNFPGPGPSPIFLEFSLNAATGLEDQPWMGILFGWSFGGKDAPTGRTWASRTQRGPDQSAIRRKKAAHRNALDAAERRRSAFRARDEAAARRLEEARRKAREAAERRRKAALESRRDLVARCMTQLRALESPGVSAQGAAGLRAEAAKYLGYLADRAAAVSLMEQAVQDEDERVRLQCVKALGQLGDYTVVPVLIQLFEGLDPGIADAARGSLKTICRPVTRGEFAFAGPGLRERRETAQSWRRWWAEGGEAQLAAAHKAREEAEEAPVWRSGALARRPPAIRLIKQADPTVVEAVRAPVSEELKLEKARHLCEVLRESHLARCIARLGLKPRPGLTAQRAALIRAEAAKDLGCLAEKAATVPLMERAVQDGSKDVRLECIKALGYVEDGAAVPVLGGALKDADPRVRRIAAVALGKIGPAAGAAVLDLVGALKGKDVHVRLSAADALGEIGPAAAEAVPDLVQALKDKGQVGGNRVRSSAGAALRKIGPASEGSVPALVGALKDADGNVRRGAVLALRAIGPAAVPALVGALKDPDRRVRLGAAGAVAGIGPEAGAAVPVLAGALKDADESMRKAAATALWRIGPAAVPALMGVLKDENDQVRLSAVRALGKVGRGAGRAVPALIQALKDEDDWVRSEASQALRRIGPATEEAVPALMGALEDARVDVRKAAAGALGRVGPGAARAVPALIQTLKDEDDWVCSQANEALRRIGAANEEDVPALGRALEDEHSGVRRAAAGALGRAGPAAREAVPFLARALRDKDDLVRLRAAVALGRIGPEAKWAAPFLTRALKDADVRVRASAARALKQVQGRE